MRTLAVLPVKSFGRAKTRLGGRADRPELAAAMAQDVLAALARVGGLEAVLVVSPAPPAEDWPAWVPDPDQAGHRAAAALGVREALRRGAERALLVPGDCPALDPADVEALLAEPAAGVTVVPDRHGSGTNALLLAPPDALAPSFGEGSLARHCALARAAGVAVRVAEPPSLLMDVDTPEDLEALLRWAPPDAAPRTRAVLGDTAAAA